MSYARLFRRWFPLVALMVIAYGSLQVARSADTDEASVTPVVYESSLGTPLISARRVPETLQAPIADDAVAPIIDGFLDSLSETQGDLQSCLIIEVNGRVLENEGANLALIPASNQKLLTTYATLQQFGPDVTFSTEVARTGEVINGVLNGDLYLVGGGDPFLITDNWRSQYVQRDEDDNIIPSAYERASSRLENLADDVVASGITSISGSIIGDETLFDTVRFGPWADRLIVQNQSGPLSALTVNEGFVSWNPDSPTFTLRTKATDPALNAVRVFADLLTERGITVGPVAVGTRPPEATEVARLQSPPLSDLITHINSWSNNFGAEILLKHLGLAVSGEGSTQAGAAAVHSILASNDDLNLTGIVIDDGSGLAETDRLTCSFINDLLITAGFDSVFGQSLSIGGERGSLAGRHENTPADGHLYAKTGTLNPATALSGFVVSADDPDIVLSFSYISNAGLVSPSLRDFQEPFIESLATYPDAPSIDIIDPLDPIRVLNEG